MINLFNTMFGKDNNPFINAFTSNAFTSSDKPSEDDSEDNIDWKQSYLKMKEDFDSYRNRTEKARETERFNLTREIIKGFLEVVDYAIFTFKAKNNIGSLTKEDEMILNKLSSFLKAYDVHPMKDPTGTPFDHNFHEAVMTDTSEMFESGTVTLTLSHGYMIGDKVLRHAKVVVAA